MALTRPSAAQLSSASVDFTDPLFRINKDQTGANNKDLGIIFERGSDTNVGLIWDESADQFALINTTETGTTSGNVSISSYANLTVSTLISSGITYPTSDGTVGQVISTDGSGNLSFVSVTATPAGSNTQVQFNNNELLGASSNLTFDGTTLTSTAFSGPLTGNVTGNASTASALATARTIALGGVLSGSTSFDGSGNVTITAAHTSDPTITLTGDVTGTATMTNLDNVSITATVADDSHNHVISNVDGLQTALDAKAALAGATFTGNVSGTNLTLSGNLTVSGTTTYINTTTLNIGDNIITLNADETGTPSQNAGIEVERGTSTNVILQWNETSDYWEIASGGTTGRILTTGDEGSGNGLDADTLDGQQGSYYLDWTNTTNKPDPTITLGGDLSGSVTLTDLASGTLTATLTKDPTITLTGDVTGSATMTNLDNVSISTTVAANSVALGTDTTGNYVAAGSTSGNGISGSVSSEGGTFTVTSNATNANTGSTIVFRDASGNFSAGTITATLSGNATTATTLQTARTIGGVSFNGSANINLPGVNTAGNQNTTGSAATLTTARTIGGVSFNGSANINLPGVNTAGNQNTSGTAAIATTVTLVATNTTNATHYPLFADAAT